MKFAKRAAAAHAAHAPCAHAKVDRSAPHSAVYRVHPGEVAFAEQGEQLDTLLGSCVSVILTDSRRTFGAMCHIVHASESVKPVQCCSHGPQALDALDEMLIARGITPSKCVAYVYGGGNMFPGHYSRRHVGEVNATWVLDALAERQIAVIHEDLGGGVYRRLRWTVGPDEPEATSVKV